MAREEEAPWFEEIGKKIQPQVELATSSNQPSTVVVHSEVDYEGVLAEKFEPRKEQRNKGEQKEEGKQETGQPLMWAKERPCWMRCGTKNMRHAQCLVKYGNRQFKGRNHGLKELE